MYEIIKNLKKPHLPSKRILQKRICSCGEKIASCYDKCNLCRRRDWEEYQRYLGIPESEIAKLSYFAITSLERQALLEAQDGKCAICGVPDEVGRPLVIDHCHITGKIRGLLCHTCNVGIGMLKDNLELIYAAAEYLQRK